MQPNDFALLADLADAYASNHQHDQAIRNYQKALDLSQASLKVNPLDLDALMVAAYSAAAVGEKQASLGYLRDALQHAPEDAEVAYYAARVHARLGDRQAAAQWIGQAISNGYSKADIATAPDLAALAR